MNSTLKLLASFAISLISTSLIYKQFEIPGWESSALLGGSILFLVITILLGIIFDLAIIPSMLFSSIITGFIMLFILTIFGIFLVFFGFVGLIFIVAYESEESDYYRY
jgi:hypothetical protein